MGRAIVRNPKVFLFDEPLSNLDAKLRVQMRTEIKRVHQKVKTTTVYVTHDQIEAMTLADRVVVMNGGIIEQVGTPHDLYHRPRTRFVAGFIGSPAMNFMPCRLEQNGAGLMVRLSDQLALPVPADRAERYRAERQGKPLTFGLRPEHITEPRGGAIEQRCEFSGYPRRDRADGHGDDGVLQRRGYRGLRAGRAVERAVAGTIDAALRQPQPHASDRSRHQLGALISGAELAGRMK